MRRTNYSRKIDSTGRVMIPVRLREELRLVSGQELFFSVMEQEGRKYLVIDCGAADGALEQAIQIVQRHGLNVVQNDD